MRIEWSAPGSFGVYTRRGSYGSLVLSGFLMRGTCAGSCWTRGQSGFYGTLGTVRSLVRARDVAIMKRVPGGFLPPLRRPAPPASDGRRFPWSPPTAVTEGPAPSGLPVVTPATVVALNLGSSQASGCTTPPWKPARPSSPGPSSPTPPSSSPTRRARQDCPPAYDFVRGCHRVALDGVDLPEVRRDALALLHQDVHVASVGNGPASLLRTWSHFHNTWFAGIVPVFPLTVGSIEAVGALFKKGRYRAVASYVSAAKDWHIELEYPWSAHLPFCSSRAWTRQAGGRLGCPRPCRTSPAI